MYILVDFDGTIVEHQYPMIGPPVTGALYWLRKFQNAGAKIILWTVRSGDTLQDAIDYMEVNGIELFGINENPDQKSWSLSPKAYGNICIDDSAFGCPLIVPAFGHRHYADWTRIGPAVLRLIEDHDNV